MEHLSLHELNQLIRQTLDQNLQPSYWVVAEISELRVTQKGHCYLELVEKQEDKVVAKTRATIWSYSYRSISGWFRTVTGHDLRNGITVLCQINVQFHELYGFSLNIKDIDAKFTLGERARRRQEIIDQLTKEGILEMNRALTLPLVPQRIAVISSPGAAGYGDFMDQLSSNRYKYHFRTSLFTSIMQGDGALTELVAALHRINSRIEEFDAVIIIRGGGSQIDLECFDNYEIASHVAQFPLPVITGIGHERDETILDLVAHTRMKTPTAVAEFLISGICSFEERLNSLMQTVSQRSIQRMRLEDQKLQTLKYKLTSVSQGKTMRSHQQIDRQTQRYKNTVKILMTAKKDKIGSFENSIRLLDPKTVLKRGYTITLLNGKTMGDHLPDPGECIETITLRSQIFSTVNKSTRHE